jgi:hypothetical protein
VRRVVVSWSALLLLVTAHPTAAEPAVRYSPPVSGVVLQPFEEPDHRYSAGHRGVDLAAPPGAPVHAAAGGVVAFTGQVAGQRWVSIDHPDGLRTAYGAVTDVEVAVGDEVARGDRLAAAVGGHADGTLERRPGLHWSARRDGDYVDPWSLVTLSLPVPTLVGPGGWRGTDPVVDAYEPYAGGSRWGMMARPSPDAQHQGYALAPNHHHLVILPGYATSGPHPILDPAKLGYDDTSSSVFSYRGCVPTDTGCTPRPYGGTDTDVPIDLGAALLEQHLRALQRAQPGRPVDLVGHSMGGDIASHYLEHVHDPLDPGLPPVGALVTIATPHGGSGVSYVGRFVGSDPVIGNLVEGGRRLIAREGRDRVLDRISLGSAPVERYGAGFGRGLPDRRPERLDELRVDVLEIAGSRDGVVAVDDAAGFGDAVVLPGGHGSVKDTEAVLQAVHDHLAGREVTGADGAAGWMTREVRDVARFGTAWLELRNLRQLGKVLVQGDAGQLLRATGKGLAPGAEVWRAHPDQLTEDRLAPSRPLLTDP